jgi:hypothetical protein
MTASLIAFVAGTLLSGLWIGAARRYPEWEKQIFGYTLVLAGVVYVFFGFIEGRAINTMMPEAIVGLGFIILAAIGLRGSLLALGIGWALHGTWDYVATVVLDVSYVPWFLEPSCIGYDFIVGLYLILRSRGQFAP